MKTRAFKKAISVLCVLSVLLSVCIVGFAGTASAAGKDYTCYNNGYNFTTGIQDGADLNEELGTPYNPYGLEFLGWYDETFTTKYDTAGASVPSNLYAKYSGVAYDFEVGQDYYDPNNASFIKNNRIKFISDPLDNNNLVLYADSYFNPNFGFARYSGINEGLKLKADTAYNITFKAYVQGGTSAANPLKLYFYAASTAGIGVGGNKSSVVNSPITITEDSTGYKTYSINLDTAKLATALGKGHEYLLMNFDHNGGTDGSDVYIDDIVVSEIKGNTITYMDKGVKSEEILEVGSVLRANSAGSFKGWFDEGGHKFEYAPSSNITLYAVYNGTYANFEYSEYVNWGEDRYITVENDPLGSAQGKVAKFDLANTDGYNFAPWIAEGLIYDYTNLSAGTYKVRFKYHATNVGSDGVTFEIRTSNYNSIGFDGGNKSTALGSFKINNSTMDWAETSFTFEVKASDVKDAIVLVVKGNDGADVYVDDIDMKPYVDASAVPPTVVDFENNYSWSVPEANNYTFETGNGYVTRGEIKATAGGDHYFQMKHFRQKKGYIWFTINDGTKQFELTNGGLYTVEFDYQVEHSETPTKLGILSTVPTDATTGLKFADLTVVDEFENRNDTEWQHAKVTVQADTSEGKTALGIYLYNSTAVPLEFATTVNFDNIKVTSNSISGEDGIVVFDDNGGDFKVDPMVVEAGYKAGSAPTITKYGYNFLGWKTEDGSIFDASTIVEPGVLKVKADWQIRDDAVAMTFRSNVAEFDAEKYTIVRMCGESMPASMLPPDPVAAGFTFLGWYYDTQFTKPLGTTAPATSGEIEVYAKWNNTGVYVVDYEDYDNKNHNGGQFSTRYSIKKLEDGNKVLCYDDSKGTEPNYMVIARAMLYDGERYVSALPGQTYTVKFKYKIEELGGAGGGFSTFLSDVTNTWTDYQKQAEVSIVKEDGWVETFITFQATLKPGAAGDNCYMSLGIWAKGVIYIDDVVITCEGENEMNHYGSAVVFVTQGGQKIPTMSGEPGEKLVLPRARRAGFIFTGWTLNPDGSSPYTATTYGDSSVTIYAQWKLGKISESFENYPTVQRWLSISGAYDMYSSDTEGFDAANVRTGNTSLFRDGSKAGDKAFFLSKSKDIELAIGENYTLSMWVKPTAVNDAAATISLNTMSKYYGFENAKVVASLGTAGGLTVGEWQEITYNFTATSKFYSVSVGAGVDMYIDDVSVTLEGYTGEDTGYLDTEAGPTGDDSISPMLVLIVAIVSLGALVVTGKKVFVK